MPQSVVLTKAILVGGVVAMLPTYKREGMQFIEDVCLMELLAIVRETASESHYDKESDTQAFVFDDLSQLDLINVNQGDLPCEIRTKEIYDGLAIRLSSTASA